MKLKKILQEITVDAALKLFNLSSSDLSDPTKIKAAYRTAALKAHPDKGGSDEAFKVVNDANEVLNKFAGKSGSTGRSRSTSGSSTSGTSSGYSRADFNKMRDEYFELGLKIVGMLKTELKPHVFIDHFNTIYNDSFQYKVVAEFPKPTDSKAHTSVATYILEFFNDSRDIVFKFQLSCHLVDVQHDNSLGGGVGNISYPLGIEAFGFYNNKKMKITQRDYQSTRNHDVLSDPELSFPKAKLEKFKTTSKTKAFKKADMILFLKNKTDGQWYDNTLSLELSPRPDRISLQFRRGTIISTASWDINLFHNGKSVRIPFAYFAENIITAQFFEELIKNVKKYKDIDSIQSYLSLKIQKFKSEHNTQQ